MKKALANTRVSVKLRKSEYREEWYLYVEAYPVFQADKSSPQRVREYLNRTITTGISRGTPELTRTAKPLISLNVI
jgi:hypothetical protein